MCTTCMSNPCDFRCPYAEEPEVIEVCSNCGYEIYRGDDYYNINEEIYCESCINACKVIGEL